MTLESAVAIIETESRDDVSPSPSGVFQQAVATVLLDLHRRIPASVPRCAATILVTAVMKQQQQCMLKPGHTGAHVLADYGVTWNG